jgi:YVTN family beta-propeller protein
VEFRILGPLEVLDGERELRLGSPKERELLAVLLLHAGSVVSRERLIDELWGESPPPTAAKALNVHVSQLRKTLAHNGHDPVATRPPGYALEVEPEAVDAVSFERLVAEARARFAAGEVESAGALLRKALALWRGPALDGVVLEAAARNEAGRLDQLRLAAQMDRIDCDLALGRHEQLVGEVEALVAEHPLRERLRSQLMLALYRSGRQADALRSYREARQTLVDELGIEPSVPLQRLERAILNHDPALELPAGIPQEGAVAPPTPPRARGRRWFAPIAAFVGFAALTAFALVLWSESETAVRVPPNSLAVIDPATNAVVQAVPVGVGPGPVTVGRGAVWVGNADDETLSRIDLRTRAVTKTFPLDGTPTGVAAGPHGIWVAYGRLGSVARVDPAFGSVGEPLHVAGRGFGYVTGDGAVADGGLGVWVVFGNSAVARISDDGGRVLRRSSAGPRPSAIGFSGREVWIANSGGHSLSVIDPQTGAQVATVTVARRPRGLAVGANAVWVSAFDDDAVSRVVGGSSRTIAVGDGPLGIAFGAGSVWVANSRDGTVSRIDPEEGKVVATIRVGHRPQGIAVGGGAVFVTVAR